MLKQWKFSWFVSKIKNEMIGSTKFYRYYHKFYRARQNIHNNQWNFQVLTVLFRTFLRFPDYGDVVNDLERLTPPWHGHRSIYAVTSLPAVVFTLKSKMADLRLQLVMQSTTKIAASWLVELVYFRLISSGFLFAQGTRAHSSRFPQSAIFERNDVEFQPSYRFFSYL